MYAFKGPAPKLAYYTSTGDAPDLPILLLLLILVHPSQSIAAEAENGKDHWFHEETYEDVSVPNHYVHARLSIKQPTIVVFDARGRVLLIEHCGAPDTQDQQDYHIKRCCNDVQDYAMPES